MIINYHMNSKFSELYLNIKSLYKLNTKKTFNTLLNYKTNYKMLNKFRRN